MFDFDHPAYRDWTELGKSIRAAHDGGKGPLKALVAISAHWQSQLPGTIEVNVDEKNPLVYDYYNFPSHYVRVPSCFSPSSPIASTLTLRRMCLSPAATSPRLRLWFFRSFSPDGPPCSTR